MNVQRRQIIVIEKHNYVLTRKDDTNAIAKLSMNV